MNLKILIVDDDKKLLGVQKSILTQEGHDVKVCSDGLEAIDKCREYRFDLIITDLMMPGASGLDVLKETKKIHQDTLVIIVTGFASLETAIQAIREGAYDYITKPFKLEEIKVVVNNARERIRLVHENQKLFQELQEAYNQLHMMKKIMKVDGGIDSEEENSTKDAGKRDKANGHYIAGSLLPLYYTENLSGTKDLVLSDLERFSILKEKGHLSEEEFNLCKSKLFKNIRH